MVIDDLDPGGSAGGPGKANTPLLVDADAMLAFAVTLEGFESVGGWNAEFVQFHHGVQQAEFPAGDGLDLRRQPSGIVAVVYPLRLDAGETLDHASNVGRPLYPSSRYIRIPDIWLESLTPPATTAP